MGLKCIKRIQCKPFLKRLDFVFCRYKIAELNLLQPENQSLADNLRATGHYKTVRLLLSSRRTWRHKVKNPHATSSRATYRLTCCYSCMLYGFRSHLHIFVSLCRAVLTSISVTYRFKSLPFAAISYSRRSFVYGGLLSKSGTLVLVNLKAEHRKNFPGLCFCTSVILGFHSV